jgi:hypothetical protein
MTDAVLSLAHLFADWLCVAGRIVGCNRSNNGCSTASNPGATWFKAPAHRHFEASTGLPARWIVSVQVTWNSILVSWTSWVQCMLYQEYKEEYKDSIYLKIYSYFQFTVAHARGFSVFTSRLLATDLSTETSTSNHYEVLLFRLQSLCTPLSSSALCKRLATHWSPVQRVLSIAYRIKKLIKRSRSNKRAVEP